uniref:Putative secreted protein n=1 Tax=Anopheles triannulatus TaxID=58253 RepID=A0A2M4AY57_9DIPT
MVSKSSAVCSLESSLLILAVRTSGSQSAYMVLLLLFASAISASDGPYSSSGAVSSTICSMFSSFTSSGRLSSRCVTSRNGFAFTFASDCFRGVCCGVGGKLLLLGLSPAIVGIERLFAELTRFRPCTSRSLKLWRWASSFPFGIICCSSATSTKSSISMVGDSGSVSLNSGCCEPDDAEDVAIDVADDTAVRRVEEDEETGRASVTVVADVPSFALQTVELWHLLMHFLWQHIAQSRHCTASLSQIFLPQ